jgi:protein-S-isoprenylcysteine O-methyltransferase
MSLGPSDVVVGAWLVLALVWLIGSFATKATVRQQSAASRLLEIGPLVVGFLLLRSNANLMEWLSSRFIPRGFAWQALGALITLAGVSVAIWARFYLGSNWSATVTVKQGHDLIRSGPYKFVRHPIYSGLLLAFLGTAILIGELRGLFALALVTVAWKIKSLREESFMVSEFGEQYEQYRHQVKALIPFVW